MPTRVTIPAELEPVAAAPPDPRAEAETVAMRDGVRLATDVYLPEPRGRPLSTVLIRMPYDKCGRYCFCPAVARHLNANGFAAVVQDVRGKFRSEGESDPFATEAADGYDTIEWIVGQGWSDGTVGMYGDSYYGFTQWAAAASGHPALRAIVPRVTGSCFHDAFAADAVERIPLYEWIVQTFTAAENFEASILSERPLGALAAMPPELASGRELLLQVVEEVRSGELARRAFGAAGPPAPRLAIPALHTGGWFDNLQKWQLDDWAAASAGPAAEHQFLRMGPSDHEDFTLSEDGRAQGDHEVDDEALRAYLPGLLEEPISFFRHYFGGGEGPWAAPRVRHRVAWAGWEESDRWPPEPGETLTLACADPDEALASADGGRLLPVEDGPSGAAATVEWDHDPADPVPFAPESEWGMQAAPGLPDESELHGRPDVVTFTGEPAERPLDLLGPASLSATVDADAPSTHLVARLLDLAPDGSSRFVLEGAVPVDCGEGPAAVRVRLGDTAYRLRPGHRLRLALSTSSFPQYLVHPGTGESPLTATGGRVARQRLRVGGGDGVRLELSVRMALSA